MKNSQGHAPKRPVSMPSSRKSMDLIEDTSQHFGPNKLTIDAHAQRQRWDAFFEPHYTFMAFIHELNLKDDEDLIRGHQKNVDRLVDTDSFGQTSPQRQSCDFALSNPNSLMASPKIEKQDISRTEQDQNVLIQRLEILKRIRAAKTTEKQDGQSNLVGRWRQQLTRKAYKLRQEVQAITEDSESKASTPTVEEDTHDDGVEKPEIKEEEPKKKIINCRRSFLFFLLGFLFPPLWLIGSIYIASYDKKQTSANRRIDKKWRHRSRVILGAFLILLLVTSVTVFVINPASVGWRHG